MTQKEVNKLFIQGEIAVKFFGIKRQSYSIGNFRITEKQFKKLESLPHNFKIIGSGFTRHVITYKP